MEACRGWRWGAQWRPAEGGVPSGGLQRVGCPVRACRGWGAQLEAAESGVPSEGLQGWGAQ